MASSRAIQDPARRAMTNCHTTGCTRPKRIRRQVVPRGLRGRKVVRRPGAATPQKVFPGVKSFEHGFDRLEALRRGPQSLPEFSDRYLRPEFTWEKDLLPKLNVFIRSAGQKNDFASRWTLPDAGVRRGDRVDTKSGKLWSSSSAARGGAAIWLPMTCL